MTAIVDTPEEAAALDRPPLLVRRPLEALLDAHGTRQRADRGRARGRGPLERDLPRAPRRRRARAAPAAAAAAAAVRARRPARGAAARRAPGRRRAHAARAAQLRRRVGDRRAVLRHGARRGRRDRTRAAGARWTRRTSGGGIGEELVDALVEIHAVDWQACGLEGFGKPTGYLDRQLRRFGGLWEHNKTRELPGARRRRRVARRAQARVGTGHDRARRLPARQRHVRPRQRRRG